VVAPDSRALVLTPICPHIAALHAVVLPGDPPFQLRLWSPEPGLLTLDGQVEESVEDGTTVEVAVSEQETIFARRGTPAELYRRILAKLAREDV
jgi:NAD kinase